MKDRLIAYFSMEMALRSDYLPARSEERKVAKETARHIAITGCEFRCSSRAGANGPS